MTGPDDVPRLHAADLPAPEDRFRLLVASLDLGYALVRLVYDDHGRPIDYVVVEHNDAMERQLGTSGAGELASVLTPGYDPDWATGFARVAESGRSERVERFDPAVDRWLDALAVRVGEPGDPLVAVVFRDVTAGHRSAELLRAGRERQAFLLRLADTLRSLERPADVMEAAAGMLAAQLGADRVSCFVVDSDGTTMSMRVDPGSARPADGSDPASGPAPESAPGLRIPVAALGSPFLAELSAGRTVVAADLATDPRIEAMDPVRSPLLATGAAIVVPLVKDGRWVALLTIGHATARAWTDEEVSLAEETADRTWASVERAQAAEALLEARRTLDEERERTLAQERVARRQAEAATLMRDEFLARVSHELRTPLAAILLWSRLLASGRAAGREAEAVEVIARNAEAQRLLVDDLLDVARARAGALSVDPQPQPLAPIIRTAASSMQPLADQKDVHLEIAVIEIDAPVDGARIGQVIRNLVDNAIRHTPPGGTIRVGMARSDSGVEIVVTDTGDGIDASQLPHIFERFRRDGAGPAAGDDPPALPPSSPAGGLGLGLSLSRELVELHRGTLTATSDGPGRGSEFTIRLPLAARPRRAAPHRAHVRRAP